MTRITRSTSHPLEAFGLGWRLVFIAGLFPVLAGLTVLAPGLLSATAGRNDPWIFPGGRQSFSFAAAAQVPPDLGALWLLLVHLCGVNLALSGVAISAVAWFALRAGQSWAPKLLWGMILWVGINVAAALLGYRLAVGHGIAYALAPTCLGIVGLVRHRAEQDLLWHRAIAEPPVFCDERFLQPDGWVRFSEAEGFAHRYLRNSSKRVVCETIMTTRGDATAAIALLHGPWDWWGRGRIARFEVLEDGSTDQILIPVGWYWAHVRMRILPAVELPELRGWRLAGRMTGSFSGSISFDVYPGPEAGTLNIRGRFHGISEKIPGPHEFVTKCHLRAESGTLHLPFPRGTGWVGLKRRLEGHAVHSG